MRTITAAEVHHHRTLEHWHTAAAAAAGELTITASRLRASADLELEPLAELLAEVAEALPAVGLGLELARRAG